MNLPHKTRQDYHQPVFHENVSFEPLRRWVRPSVWIMLGFIIGLMCTKMLATKQTNQIVFNENLPDMAFKTSALLINELPATASA